MTQTSDASEALMREVRLFVFRQAADETGGKAYWRICIWDALGIVATLGADASHRDAHIRSAVLHSHEGRRVLRSAQAGSVQMQRATNQ